MHDAELRALGERLAGYLRDPRGRQATAAGRQALVADLFASREELLIPLKDVVSRRGFEALLDPASANRGGIQRDALLRELQQIYAPAVLARVADVLNGFLGLPPESAAPPAPSPAPAPPSVPAPASTPVQPPPVEAAPRAQVWPEPPRPQPQARPQPQRQPRVQPQPQVPQPPLPSSRSPGCLVLGLLAGGTLILSLQLLISLRSSEFCRLTGLCPAELAPGSEGSPLRPALAAAEALQATGSMGDFEQALGRLEGQLQRLRSEALTPEDQQQLGVLEAMAGQARQRLQAERLDEERLRRAEVVLLNAEQAAPAERPALISQVAAELEAITRGSFAAPQADALRLRLQRLEQEAAPADPAADGAGTAPQPDSGQPGSGQPTAPPDPQPLPAPERASPPGSEAQVAPERTQPGEPG